MAIISPKKVSLNVPMPSTIRTQLANLITSQLCPVVDAELGLTGEYVSTWRDFAPEGVTFAFNEDGSEARITAEPEIMGSWSPGEPE